MGCVDRACVPRAAGGLPRQEYVLHTIIFLLHGAFVGVVIANAGQLVHGAGFGVLRWPSLPSFMVVGAVALLLVSVVFLVLHLSVMWTGLREIRRSASAVHSPGDKSPSYHVEY